MSDFLEDPCTPFEACEELPGRLLIHRTYQGPVLALEEGEIPFGALTMHGAEIRPYVELFLRQEWTIKEACYGPVRSVFGLAPGETVTMDTARYEQADYATLVREALDDTVVDTQTSRSGTELVDVQPAKGGGASIGLFGALVGGSGGGAQAMVLGLPTPGDVVGAATGIINSIFGGGGGGAAPPALQDVLTTVDEVIHTIETTQSRHTLTETSESRSVGLEQRITRTFKNPYRDRSLELRFIPTFRCFEVTTVPFIARIGMALTVSKLEFPKVGMGRQYGQFLEQRLADPRIASVAHAELGVEDDVRLGVRSGAVYEHLEANAELYTKRFVEAAHQDGNFEWLRAPLARLLTGSDSARAQAAAKGSDCEEEVSPEALLEGFVWSNIHAEGNVIKVPLASLDTLRDAWQLDKGDARRLGKALERLAPDSLAALLPEPPKREVKLFMGTHIEAVAGRCILEDVPPPVCCEPEPEA